MVHLKYLLLVLLAWSMTSSVQGASLDEQRATFKKANYAIKQGRFDLYQLHAQKLKDYPLLPYLEFAFISKRIKMTKNNPALHVQFWEIESFFKRYPDVPVNRVLLHQWLKERGKYAQWSLFRQGWSLADPALKSTSMKCLKAHADYSHTRNKLVLTQALSLWNQGRSAPKACDGLFALMQSQGVIKNEHIRSRLEKAIGAHQWGLAKYLNKQLPADEQALGNAWIQVVKNPNQLEKLSNQALIKASNQKESIVWQSFHRLNRLKPEQSKTVYASWARTFSLSDNTRMKMREDLGVRLAHQRDVKALDWLSGIPHDKLGLVAHHWLIRYNLLLGEFGDALKHIDALPQQEKKRPIWQYWRARSLEQIGELDRANRLYQGLAKQRHYYGLLASSRLSKPFELNHQPASSEPNMMDELSDSPVIKRIRELKHHNRITQSRAEWVAWIKSLSKQEQIAASVIAQQEKWPDFSIIAITRANQYHALEMRFPKGYGDDIERIANKLDIDPHWVFALTRQESLFSSAVKSSAGAYGLMQLMPATARYVATKFHLPKPSIYDLKNPDINLSLGTTYLKSLYDKFDGHMIISTASYNAGLNRVESWLPLKPVDADIWIDAMPFLETRNYVKNIVATIGVYRGLEGQPLALDTIMVPVQKIEP